MFDYGCSLYILKIQMIARVYKYICNAHIYNVNSVICDISLDMRIAYSRFSFTLRFVILYRCWLSPSGTLLTALRSVVPLKCDTVNKRGGCSFMDHHPPCRTDPFLCEPPSIADICRHSTIRIILHYVRNYFFIIVNIRLISYTFIGYIYY